MLPALVHDIHQSLFGSILCNCLIVPSFSLSRSFLLPSRQGRLCKDQGTSVCPFGACAPCTFFQYRSQQADHFYRFQLETTHFCHSFWQPWLSCLFEHSAQLHRYAKDALKDTAVEYQLQSPACFHLF